MPLVEQDGKTSHSEQNTQSTSRFHKVRRSEFLPPVSLGRRLMLLEGEDITKADNPFKIESNTERVLAYGERSREVEKLSKDKYALVQKVADNEDYV